MESTHIGTVYLQGIDHASLPWPMVSAKGGGKILPATPSDSTCFTTAIKRKGEKGNYIVYVGEKGTYNHDDIIL